MHVADTFDLGSAPIWRSLTYLRTPAIHTGHAGIRAALLNCMRVA